MVETKALGTETNTGIETLRIDSITIGAEGEEIMEEETTTTTIGEKAKGIEKIIETADKIKDKGQETKIGKRIMMN